MSSLEVKKLPFGHHLLQNSEDFTLNEQPDSQYKTIKNICNRTQEECRCTCFQLNLFPHQDDADVATAKTEFDQLYRDALGGDDDILKR